MTVRSLQRHSPETPDAGLCAAADTTSIAAANASIALNRCLCTMFLVFRPMPSLGGYCFYLPPPDRMRTLPLLGTRRAWLVGLARLYKKEENRDQGTGIGEQGGAIGT